MQERGKNQQLSNFTGVMCFYFYVVGFLPQKEARKWAPATRDLSVEHLKTLCKWADRHRGLKVDSSVMHDRGTGLFANSTSVLLTARSAFTHLHTLLGSRFLLWDHRPISRVMGQQPTSTYLCVCVYRCVKTALINIFTCHVTMVSLLVTHRELSPNSTALLSSTMCFKVQSNSQFCLERFLTEWNDSEVLT